MEAESGVSQNLPSHSLASSVVYSSYSSRGKCLYAGGGEGEGGQLHMRTWKRCCNAWVCTSYTGHARFLREAFVVLVV